MKDRKRDNWIPYACCALAWILGAVVQCSCTPLSSRDRQVDARDTDRDHRRGNRTWSDDEAEDQVKQFNRDTSRRKTHTEWK